MRPWSKPFGLRATVTVSFAAGALLLSTLLAAGTYIAARHYLVDQRERVALRQAYADASFVRDGLLTAGAREGEVIGALSPPSSSDVLLLRDGQWFSSALGDGSATVPPGVAQRAADGVVSLAWTRTTGGPSVVVGVPLPAVDAQFFEISSTSELAETLRTLSIVLTIAAVLTTVGGGLLGRAAARRLLVPLDTISSAAADIAVGRLDTRLPGTEDPDLAVIVGSFNSMVETLQDRIERDARFAADLSHELRSPLTTLSTSVDVLLRRRDDLSERGQQALDLVAAELERLKQALEDLLELGRLDAGVAGRDLVETDLADLVGHVLVESRRPVSLLHGAGDDGAALPVLVDRAQIKRALLNLFANADTHGEGLTRGDRDPSQRASARHGRRRRTGRRRAGSRAHLRALRPCRLARLEVGHRPGAQPRRGDRAGPWGDRLVHGVSGRRRAVRPPAAAAPRRPRERAIRRGDHMRWAGGRRRGRARSAAAAALLCVLSVASLRAARCHDPPGARPQRRALSPPQSERGPLGDPTPSTRTTTPDVYLLDGDGRLVPVAASPTESGLVPVLGGVLSRLAAGPREAERASGLASALGPDVRLTLVGVADGTATIEVDVGEQDPSASRLPLAVGQVVLSATSVEGVDRVQLVQGGSPIEVPLPDGALTLGPVTADDYAALLVPTASHRSHQRHRDSWPATPAEPGRG